MQVLNKRTFAEYFDGTNDVDLMENDPMEIDLTSFDDNIFSNIIDKKNYDNIASQCQQPIFLSSFEFNKALCSTITPINMFPQAINQFSQPNLITNFYPAFDTKLNTDNKLSLKIDLANL